MRDRASAVAAPLALRGEMQDVMRGEQLAVLVFEVGGHRYGVRAEDVRELVRAVLPARLPAAPRVIAGVINVRGRVVPLIDLRARFRMPAKMLSIDEVFVLVNVGPRVYAIRADRAVEILQVSQRDLAVIAETAPRASYVAGTVSIASGVLVLVDVALFLDEAERATLDAALASANDEGVTP